MAEVPTKLRIVGGGLTGVLAALSAHRMGWRDIELHEHHDALGGSDLPRMDHGVELRTRPWTFGDRTDPWRRLLEDAGVAFDDVENRLGAVSPLPCGDVALTRDFDGPTLRTRDFALTGVQETSLADRLRAYPTDIGHPLARYCQWRLGAWLDEVDVAAAPMLGLARVFPSGGDVAQVAAARRSCPQHAALYGLPRALCGRLDDTVAGVPSAGFVGLFGKARQTLERLGVVVRTGRLLSPHEALSASGDALLWTGDPKDIFPIAGIDPPKAVGRSLASYVFKARYAGPVPFALRNYTAQGVVAELGLYESRGQVMLTARCVAEASDADVRREIHRLMAGFGGASLTIGEQMLADVGPRESVPTVAAAASLKALRNTMAARMGDGFIDAGWNLATGAERLARIEAGLAAARDAAIAQAA